MKDSIVGYYRQPTINNDFLVFVCEADLWFVTDRGGQARRLTANQIGCSSPYISPDGEFVAFTALEEGSNEVYVMPVDGGSPLRVTYQGSMCLICGWTFDSQNVLYSSIHNQPFFKSRRVWTVSRQGGYPQLLNIGPASRISCSPDGGKVISRNEQEYSIWKRYKGGTKGDLWIDLDGSGEFEQILPELDGNLCNPMWINNRIYFLSDYEGHGNLYSCQLKGTDIQRHTDHEDFYVRAATTDGKRIVYQCGGEIFVYDPALKREKKIDIHVNSSKPQSRRKFVDPARYMESNEIHPRGHKLLVTSRGKVFALANWEREVQQLGVRDGVRYRLSKWLPDGKRIVNVSDEGGEEALEIHVIGNETALPHKLKRFDNLDTGRILGIVPAPEKDEILITNQRNELILIDLATSELKVIDKSHFSGIRGMSFSPDGNWIAYSATKIHGCAQIFLHDRNNGINTAVTDTVGGCMQPHFDPDGKYLFLISYRIYDPVYDSLRFDIGFPKGGLIYAITLNKDEQSPFNLDPKPLVPEPKKKENEPDTEELKAGPVTVDLDGIQRRLIAFPIAEGIYEQIGVTKGKVYYIVSPVRGALGDDDMAPPHGGALKWFDLDTKKEDTCAEQVASFDIAADGQSILYQSNKRLRVVKVGVKAEVKEDTPSRESGWIDLQRIRVSVMPTAEWNQMYRELWRLQREHFWTPTMSCIDWEEVYERYKPVLSRIATRREFSDFAWEVHGELGTSHTYEVGGDVPIAPQYRIGKLAADFDKIDDKWMITHICQGESWLTDGDSPLNAPGLNIEVGDELIAIDDMTLEAVQSPDELFVNKASTEVSLTIKHKRDDKIRRLIVKTLTTDQPVRYREWVEQNRRRVHEASEGKCGYVHVPNMEAQGYAEFFRSYLTESNREAIIVDVRYNGGGHVSQLLLEKLNRRRIGYFISHHLKPDHLPMYSVLGPIVAITNEDAGSDGDIFSHSFKMMNLGTLIGTRTWGGVVGISSHARLVDGALVTQPEFATYFTDVGYGVENYGTDPDIAVLLKPQDYAKGYDRQLETAITLILEKLEKDPPLHPNFSRIPDRSIPKLPQNGEQGD